MRKFGINASKSSSRHADNRDLMRQDADGEDKEHSERRSGTEGSALYRKVNYIFNAGGRFL